MKQGFQNLASRYQQAIERFLAYACEHARLSRADAEKALAAYRKAKVIRFDAVNGQFYVKHGAFLEPDVLRRAAHEAPAPRRRRTSRSR